MPVFDEYRKTNETRDRLLARKTHLLTTARRRRRRRLKDHGEEADRNLERCEARLAETEARWQELRNKIAEAAYLVAENYWPKFFLKGRRLDRLNDTASVNCPATEKDDCVQSAVLKILNYAHKYDSARGSLLGFLTEVCKNEFLSWIRKVQQRAVNVIRHIEKAKHETEEVEEKEDELVVVAPDFNHQRLVTSFASYGADDETTSIRFSLRRAKRTKPVQSLAKYVSARAG